MKILTSVINEQNGIRAYIIPGDRVLLDSYYLGDKKLTGYSKDIDDLEGIGIYIYTANQLKQQINLIRIYK